ncbi:MAG: pre-peptidase C-terminal domain-containing protein, partial [Verrucomicrobia bacterium]|nr:pre-peptidase C-terminal domain-containing protein [Verrucomicrobiota bacterium]
MRPESSRKRFELELLEPRVLLSAEPTGTAAPDLATAVGGAAVGGAAVVVSESIPVSPGSSELMAAFEQGNPALSSEGSIFDGVECVDLEEELTPEVSPPASDLAATSEPVNSELSRAEVPVPTATFATGTGEAKVLAPAIACIEPASRPADSPSTLQTFLTDTLKAPNGPPALTELAAQDTALGDDTGDPETVDDPAATDNEQPRSRPLQPMGGEADDMIGGATQLELVEDPTGTGFFVGRANEQIDVAEDIDYWRFNALAGDLVAVSLDTYGSGLDVYIELRNSADGVIASDNNGGPGNDDLISNYRIGSSGSYYVRVRSYGGVGTYEVRVELARGMDL